MGFTLRTLGGAFAALSVAACASAPTPKGEGDTTLARTVHESTFRAAVARPGVTVCRQLMVGIAERDWVRGRVAEVRDAAVGVRINNPGRFPHILQKTPVVPGAVLWAAPDVWTPCV